MKATTKSYDNSGLGDGSGKAIDGDWQIQPDYLLQFSHEDLKRILNSLESAASSYLPGQKEVEMAIRTLKAMCEDIPKEKQGVNQRDFPGTRDEYLAGNIRAFPFKSFLQNTRSKDLLVDLAISVGFIADARLHSLGLGSSYQGMDSSLRQLKNGLSERGASKSRLAPEQRRTYLDCIPDAGDSGEIVLPIALQFQSGKKANLLRKVANNMQLVLGVAFHQLEASPETTFRRVDIEEIAVSVLPPSSKTGLNKPKTYRKRTSLSEEDLGKDVKRNSDWQVKLATTHPFDDRIKNNAHRENTGHFYSDHIGAVEEKIGILTVDELLDLKTDEVCLASIAYALHPVRDVLGRSPGELGIDLQTLSMRREIKAPPEAFESENPIYVNRTTSWDSPLPKLLARFERSLIRSDVLDVSFAQMCSENAVNPEQRLKARLAQISQKYFQTPIAVDQFEEQLPLLMKNINFSDAEIYWSLGRKNHIPPVQCHYESSTVDQMVHRHNLGFEAYFAGALDLDAYHDVCGEPGGLSIGACRMDPKDWRAMLENFQTEYELALAQAMNSPVRWHNELTRMTLLYILVTTGIRMTNFPLCFLMQRINEDFSLVFPEDKETSAFHGRRIAALPSSAATVIIGYIQHIKRLALWLHRKGQFELAGKFQALVTAGVGVYKLPMGFFTEISDSFEISDMKKGDYERSLGDEWLPRIDEARIQLCCFLKSRGAPDYLIEDQLGHMLASSPQFSMHHDHSVMKFRREMQFHLEAYANWLGWFYEQI